jgi:hypothetical protein
VTGADAALFAGLIVALFFFLWLDLHFFARGREANFREAVLWSIGWLVLSLLAAIPVLLLEGTPADAPLRIAVVAAQDVGYGLARMWETLAEPRPVQTAVFRSRAMALAWLAAAGISEAELPPVP